MTTEETNVFRIFERGNVKKIYGWAHNRRRMLDNKNKRGYTARRRVIFIEIPFTKLVWSC
jgi:hypothetical protein